MSSDYYGAAGEIAGARRAQGMTADCDGNPLGVGDRVAAWRIGVQYTAVVKEIGDYGDGRNENFRRLTLVRDDDEAEVEGFSNLVMVIRPAGAARGRHFPGSHFTDLTYGNGGQSRHQCGGCGSPIQPRYDAWLHALTRSADCPGNTADADFWAENAKTTIRAAIDEAAT